MEMDWHLYISSVVSKHFILHDIRFDDGEGDTV